MKRDRVRKFKFVGELERFKIRREIRVRIVGLVAIGIRRNIERQRRVVIPRRNRAARSRPNNKDGR